MEDTQPTAQTATTPATRANSRYLTPTVEQPSEEMMAEGFWGCESYVATDGCPVEYDGNCPHGHVSWYRYLYE